MDLSSQHQQGQEYQSWQSQSQSQSYDPSAYNPHHQHQSYYYDSYYYQQYPNGYAYTPNQSNAHHPRQLHAPPIHPPGASPADLSAQAQENVYHPPPQQGSGDISAAAAATYLTSGLQQGHRWYPQLDAYGPVVGGPGLASGPAPRPYGLPPLPPPAAQSFHKFGSKRGGKPLRGGGRGKPLRGRGRNQGRGGSRLLSSFNINASVGKNTLCSRQEAGPSTNNHGKEANSNGLLQVTASIQNNAASNQQSKVARCELCMVDCTSLEVLEQHKLGKRHQKNMKKLEPLKNFNAPISESLDGKKVADGSTLQTEIQVEESKPSLSETLPSGTVQHEAAAMGSEEQKDEAENPNVPVEAKIESQAVKRRVNQFNNQKRGSKRKTRGGKRMRMSDTPRPEREPPKPKVVIPLVCDLCNVKCDTQEVLDRHLSGKKHMSKRKHFEVHQAMYGPLGLQVLYPPNPVTLHSQGHQQALYVPQAPDPSTAAVSLPSQTQNAVS
ncbi:PREDICTED: zinc finger RNA-binding protein 2-like [Ipomoea nil]|uniref:zinc finger RNA-binding protein 2-like n=1 Tax=Ipomoea nil TaxID=35883 RepID=UPI000901BEE7|nr:PREDICTED: zinc finger RNA-binding protein 2-like [Ipomoea nil]